MSYRFYPSKGVLLQSSPATEPLIFRFQIYISDGGLMKIWEVRRKTRYTTVSLATLVLMFWGSLVLRKFACSQSSLRINIEENKVKPVHLCLRHLIQILAPIARSQYIVNTQVLTLTSGIGLLSSTKTKYL